MNEKIADVIRHLESNSSILAEKKAFVGFDGFIDSIVRIIKTKSVGKLEFYRKMTDFADHIYDRQGKSCSVELKEAVSKIGGNMPIFGNALGKLSIKTACIGSMGASEINPIFYDMSENCTLYSFADPGYSTAIEFDDGKILLAQMEKLHNISWSHIKSILSESEFVKFFNESDFIGLVNWSELDNSTEIWEGIIEDVLPHHQPSDRQFMFFDLSDCSKRESEDILHVMSLINIFSKHFKVILSLNENEANMLFFAISGSKKSDSLDIKGTMIFESLKINTLVIHPSRYSMAWNESGMHRAETFFIENPTFSTGGGDNFNAGLAAGFLTGLELESSLLLANSVSGFYVKHGFSPDLEQLIKYLNDLAG